MNTTGKGPKAPVTPASGEKFDVLGSATEVYTKSIERLAEIQKQGLDLVAQQNAGPGRNLEEESEWVRGHVGTLHVRPDGHAL